MQFRVHWFLEKTTPLMFINMTYKSLISSKSICELFSYLTYSLQVENLSLYTINGTSPELRIPMINTEHAHLGHAKSFLSNAGILYYVEGGFYK